MNKVNAKEKELAKMSPFEIKNTLIDLAKKDAKKSTRQFLNAGRGNPDWIATVPREAFFLLGQWALTECTRNYKAEPGIAGIPSSEGAMDRLNHFLMVNSTLPGAIFLHDAINYCINTLGIDPDSLAYEWAEGIIGDQYPTPVRMLEHSESIVRAYLAQEMGNNAPGQGKEYDLFATEGGTAAMCYIFDSLQANHLINKNDTIALMTPIFTPYIEIPELDRYEFNVINISASQMDEDGLHTWQYPDSELDKLRNPEVKLLCLVNPSNPPSYKLDEECMKKIVDIVKNDNPNLMIVTDDVYGTFAKDFKSLMYELPLNTLCVYSFSKYFGATGWRLAVIALAKDNIYDRLITQEPEIQRKDLFGRYRSLTPEPDGIKFIDRIVADSRSVALNHTAGLSTPQQIQMVMFALMCLVDKENTYKKAMQEMIEQRLKSLWDSAGLTLVDDPDRVGYYSEIDIMVWGKKFYGEEFCQWLKDNHESLDIVLRLAKETSVVLLNGSGFAGPDWSVRASLANLTKNDYIKIGEAIRQILDSYHDEYLKSKEDK
ncbi:MAG: bifunctional aspartate transaminase/aspartate 4-decarboxylase [Muribaculaceae bacterium]|nr:bifunctional aspartate transaminase/aspartate 4-decarboxylase [Muribaculaceae bacterium]MDE6322060.1 bifunctional aspartate transaminase/aspartate 4-decarboxylase [Muribaculaceae bacterium]